MLCCMPSGRLVNDGAACSSRSISGSWIRMLLA
jgi:hypothetical protein